MCDFIACNVSDPSAEPVSAEAATAPTGAPKMKLGPRCTKCGGPISQRAAQEGVTLCVLHRTEKEQEALDSERLRCDYRRLLQELDRLRADYEQLGADYRVERMLRQQAERLLDQALTLASARLVLRNGARNG